METALAPTGVTALSIKLPPEIKLEIDAVIKQTKLSESEAIVVADRFSTSFAPFLELKAEAEQIIVESADEKDKIDRCREIDRILLEADKQVTAIHKVEKEKPLRAGQLADGIRRVYSNAIDRLREHVKAQINFAKIQHEKKVAAIAEERMSRLAVFNHTLAISMTALGEMPDEQFVLMLSGAETHYKDELRKEQIAKEAAVLNNRRVERMRKLSQYGLRFNGTAYTYDELTVVEDDLTSLSDEDFEARLQPIAKEIERRESEKAAAKASEDARIARVNSLSALGFSFSEALSVYAYRDDQGADITISKSAVDSMDDESFKAVRATHEQAINERRLKKIAAEEEARAKAAEAEAARQKQIAQDTALRVGPDKERLLAFVASVRQMAPPELATPEGGTALANYLIAQSAALVTLENAAQTLAGTAPVSTTTDGEGCPF